MKPWVYIASPYTKGDPGINTRFQMQMFDELMNDGVVFPYPPLWSHFQHIAFPRKYQDWIDYDLAIIDRLDACLRLNAKHEPTGYFMGESSGADGEVAHFNNQGKPVFYSKEELYDWAGRLRRDNKPQGFSGTTEGPITTGPFRPVYSSC